MCNMYSVQKVSLIFSYSACWPPRSSCSTEHNHDYWIIRYTEAYISHTKCISNQNSKWQYDMQTKNELAQFQVEINLKLLLHVMALKQLNSTPTEVFHLQLHGARRTMCSAPGICGAQYFQYYCYEPFVSSMIRKTLETENGWITCNIVFYTIHYIRKYCHFR